MKVKQMDKRKLTNVERQSITTTDYHFEIKLNHPRIQGSYIMHKFYVKISKDVRNEHADFLVIIIELLGFSNLYLTVLGIVIQSLK